MPPVSVCGRFDNAPAHMIIISTRYCPRALGAEYSTPEKPEIDLEAKAAENEVKYREHQMMLHRKAEARAMQSALDKTAKEERSRAEKAKFLERNKEKEKSRVMDDARSAMERIKARKSTPEYKARENARAKAKRAAVVRTIPDGYATIAVASKDSGMSASGMNAAAKKGFIPGMVISGNWYVHEQTAREYAAGKHERNVQRLRAVSPKGKQCHTEK